MAKVDKLEVEIVADTKDLEDGLKRSSDSLATLGLGFDKAKKESTNLSATTGTLAKNLKGPLAAAAAAAAVAVGGLYAVVENLNSKAGLKRMADRVNIGVEKFQELSFAAKMVGLDSESMADAIKDLNVKITDTAKNGGLLEDALSAIGLNAKDLVDLSPEEQFRAFADAIKSASDEAGNFAADEINDAMFQMLPLLRKGSDGLDEMAKEARDLNAVMTETELEAMQKASSEIAKMNTAFEAMFDELTLIVSGPLQTFAETVTGILKNLNSTSKVIDEIKQKAGPVSSGRTQTGEVDLSGMDAGGINLGEVDKEAQENFKKEMAKLGSVPLSSYTPDNIRSGGVSDSEEAQAIDDIAKILGLSKSSAEALGEAMDFQQENLDWQISAHETAQESLRNLTLQRINDELKAEQDKAAAEERLRKLKYQATKSAVQSLSSLMNTENRKMFEVGKAASIANAIIKTYESVNTAMAAFPPPFSFIAGAAALAAGLNNVNNIRSTSFGSAGGGAASTGGAPGLGSDGSTTAAPSVQTTNFDVTLQGDSFSGDQVRGLIGQINDATDDGVKLNAVMVR